MAYNLRAGSSFLSESGNVLLQCLWKVLGSFMNRTHSPEKLPCSKRLLAELIRASP